MDTQSALLSALTLILVAIVVCRAIEASVRLNLPPSSPESPKSDFQILTEVIDSELERLHKELNNINSDGSMYQSVVSEIGRLNQQLIKQYTDTAKTQEISQ
jgi:hypothetical protein